MSGRKAKLQRKLERERFGTDTVAFKRGRTDKVVAARQQDQDFARSRAEARAIQLERLKTLAKERQDRVKHLVSLEMPSAAVLAAAVSLGTRRADGGIQDVLDGVLGKSKTGG